MNDILWYTHSAKAWEEALPVGNGSMGAMIYGDPVRERISLNEDTLWSGTPRDKNNKEAARYLPEIRALMAQGRIVEAEDMINRYTLGEMCETYLPFADMEIISTDGVITNYRRELDMAKGLFKMTCEKDANALSEEVFASFPDKLIVIKLESAMPDDFEIVISSKLKYELKKDFFRTEISGIAPESNLPTVRGVTPPTVYGDENTSEAIRFCGIFEIKTDGRTEDDPLVITGATRIEIRISLATSFISPFEVPTADAAARAEEHIVEAEEIPYGELTARHVADFSALYDAFDISIGKGEPDIPTDERLAVVSNGGSDPSFVALLVKYGRYLMISSSRPGSRATNLQGIWNDKLHPAWCSNYTVNINTEMNYWPAEPTGLSECAEPLFDFIAERSITGARTAKLHYGCRGWVMHCNSDIWGYTTSCGPVNDRRGCSRYATWQGGSGWLCRHLWEHYEYTKDEKFLAAVFPIMFGAARFYLDFMYEDKDGSLVTSPSLSPENIYYKNGDKVSADIMPTMDREIIAELLDNCIEAAKILGDVGRADELMRARRKIPSLKVNKDGTLSEWSRDYEEAEPDHRHVSHLYGLYPSRSINLSTKNLIEAAEKTLDRRGTQGTGWGIMWKTCLYARIGNADKAYSMFRLIYNRLPCDAPMGNTGGGLYDNLFDACPPFQIDGNFGAVAAVCEMLCRDDGNGKITLLPACPKEWDTGEVRGLRIRGGKVVNFAWENGKITKSVIKNA